MPEENEMGGKEKGGKEMKYMRQYKISMSRFLISSLFGLPPGDFSVQSLLAI